MTSGILSKLIEEIGDTQAEVRAESYTMVNVRPGEKVGALLELLSELSKKNPSALVTDALSSRLAVYATSCTDNADAILNAAESALKQDGVYGFQHGSALDILEKAGVIEVENSLQKQIREKLFSPKQQGPSKA